MFLQSRKSGNFQIARAGWIADYAAPMTFADFFSTTSGNNCGKYKNTTYDQLVEIARKSTDQNVGNARRGKIPHRRYGSDPNLLLQLPSLPKSQGS